MLVRDKILNVLRAGGSCWRVSTSRRRRWWVVPPGDVASWLAPSSVVRIMVDKGLVEIADEPPDQRLVLKEGSLMPRPKGVTNVSRDVHRVGDFEFEVQAHGGGWSYTLESAGRAWRYDWRPWWTRQDAIQAAKRATHTLERARLAQG